VGRFQAGSKQRRIEDPSPEDAAWVDTKITPQPWGFQCRQCSLPVRAKSALQALHSHPLFPQPVFDASLARCEADKTWKTATMHECGHDPMIDRPQALCELLEDV
jgi:hypothetical protein